MKGDNLIIDLPTCQKNLVNFLCHLLQKSTNKKCKGNMYAIKLQKRLLIYSINSKIYNLSPNNAVLGNFYFLDSSNIIK